MITIIITAKCWFMSMKDWEIAVEVNEYRAYPFDSWTRFLHWEIRYVFFMSIWSKVVFNISIKFYYMLNSNKHKAKV